MQSSAWRSLLKHIPPEKLGMFSVVTLAGIEVSLQCIMRLDEEFVVFKGRLSGTQEQGRIFFIPYAMIDHFSFSQPTRDSDYTDIFGDLVIDGEAAPEEVAPPAAALPGDKSGSGIRTPIRSEILDRFRSRPTGTSSISLPNVRPNGDG